MRPITQNYDSLKRSVLNITTFKGVDMTNSSPNVDDARSPHAPNMIRDVPGKVRKRMGYKKTDRYYEEKEKLDEEGNPVLDGEGNAVKEQTGLCIYGVFVLDYSKDKERKRVQVVHAGNKLFRKATQKELDGEFEEGEEKPELLGDKVVLYEGINEARSKAWQIDEKLYMLDGLAMLMYDGEKVKRVDSADVAYIPTRLINKDPAGGGVEFEPFNLLQSRFKERFVVTQETASATVFSLSTTYLDHTEITVEVLKSNGSWADCTEVTEFGSGANEYKVDRKEGVVSFKSALWDQTKADNIKITLKKTAAIVEEYEQTISATTELEYALDKTWLSDTLIEARKLGQDEDGDWDWVDLTYGVDYKVDADKGKVTFTTAPGESPATGRDNIEITAAKQRGETEDFTDEFLGDGTTKTFQLSKSQLYDPHKTVVRVMNSSGVWKQLKYTKNTNPSSSYFKVDRAAGQVTLGTAPVEWTQARIEKYGVEKNVEIKAYTMTELYSDQINKCTSAVLYGAGVEADRLFVTGNSDYPSTDWYSQINDPTYFGDLWYAKLGQDNSKIVGYSVVGNYLATHKDKAEDGRNIFLRNGTLTDGKATFPIVGTLQGEGAIAPHAFGYLSTEPLFLTRMGIYAITAADLTGEKYAQNRSFYINGALCEEKNLKDAYGFVYKDYYLLCLNKKVYILDGLQKAYEKNAPYSTHQYECYFWDSIDAHVMFESEEGALCFGTPGGYMMEFYDEPLSQQSYSDETETGKEPIRAHWDLADVGGKLFFKNKTFRRIYVMLAAAIATGVKVLAQKRGIWQEVYDAKARARYLDFSYIDFSKFVFSSDTTPRTVGGKFKIMKVDKARFRLLNYELDEPFGIYSVAIEYTENANYKGEW